MKNIIASYPLCNTASVNIYDIRYGIEDEILAGINNDIPEWCRVYDVEDDEEIRLAFNLGTFTIFLDDCIRV